MALEPRDSMQNNYEGPVKCLQVNELAYNLQLYGNSFKGSREFKDETGHSGVNFVGPEQPLSRELSEPLNEYHHELSYHQNFGSWLAVYSDYQKLHQCHIGAYGAQIWPYPEINRLQYGSSNVLPQKCHHEFQFQDFQYFVVIDFEATCDREKNPHPQEIIEFPSVIVSSLTGQLEACFQTYVRPTCNQLLSDFCKDLTGIQQIQVDRGVTLNEALIRHDKWLEKKGIKNTNFAVVTWSNWDCRVMLESECRYKKIQKPPYFNRWINLRVPFHEVFGGVRCNLKEAVQMAGLTWQGRAHCGLDDAKNTARLLALLMRKGIKFSITNSLTWETTNQPLTWMQQPERPLYSPHQAYRPKELQISFLNYHPHCFCGVKSSRGMVQKPGPRQGSFFFGCGNWSATRGARCQYFQWASC